MKANYIYLSYLSRKKGTPPKYWQYQVGSKLEKYYPENEIILPIPHD